MPLEPIDPEHYREIDVNDQVMLIRASLYESVLTGDWDNMSFYRFLNRAAFNLRSPHTFLIFDMKHNAYRAINSDPPPDPLFRPAIEELLSDLRGKTLSSDVSAKNVGSLSPFINRKTTYLFLPLETCYDWPHSPYATLQASYQPVPKKVRTNQFLSAVFSDFGETLREDLDANGHVKDMLTRAASLYPDRSMVHAAHSKPDGRRINATDEFKVVRAMAWDHIERICGDTYADERKSPLIAPRRKMPANIVMFAKVFDRTSTRYGAYHYTCRPVIPERQRLDWITALSALTDSAPTRTDDTFVYAPPILDMEPESDATQSTPEPHKERRLPEETKWRFAPGRPAYREADEKFWSLLLSEGGPEAILRLIEKPLPDCTRMFADGVLTSSFSEVIDEPLANPRVCCLRSDAPEEELLRMAAWHYVLSLMAHDSPDKPLHHSLLTLPFRTAGATTLAVATVRSHHKADDGYNETAQSVIDIDDFKKSYLIYKSLMIPFERRFRRRTKESYITDIANITAYNLEAHAVRKNVDTPYVVSEFVLQKINRQIRELAAYYSYPLVEMEVPGDHEEGIFSRQIYGFDIKAKFDDNPYFDFTQCSDFLSESDLVFLVYHVVMAAMAKRQRSQSGG